MMADNDEWDADLWAALADLSELSGCVLCLASNTVQGVGGEAWNCWDVVKLNPGVDYMGGVVARGDTAMEAIKKATQTLESRVRFRPYASADEAIDNLRGQFIKLKDSKANVAFMVTDFFEHGISREAWSVSFEVLLEKYEIYKGRGKVEPCGIKLGVKDGE